MKGKQKTEKIFVFISSALKNLTAAAWEEKEKKKKKIINVPRIPTRKENCSKILNGE